MYANEINNSLLPGKFCMLFYCLLIFFKNNFFKNSFSITIKKSNKTSGLHLHFDCTIVMNGKSTYNRSNLAIDAKLPKADTCDMAILYIVLEL